MVPTENTSYMGLPIWDFMKKVKKERKIITTPSYLKMKENEIAKRRAANKNARKVKKLTCSNISPGRCKRRFLKG